MTYRFPIDIQVETRVMLHPRKTNMTLEQFLIFQCHVSLQGGYYLAKDNHQLAKKGVVVCYASRDRRLILSLVIPLHSPYIN